MVGTSNLGSWNSHWTKLSAAIIFCKCWPVVSPTTRTIYVRCTVYWSSGAADRCGSTCKHHGWYPVFISFPIGILQALRLHRDFSQFLPWLSMFIEGFTMFIWGFTSFLWGFTSNWQHVAFLGFALRTTPHSARKTGMGWSHWSLRQIRAVQWYLWGRDSLPPVSTRWQSIKLSNYHVIKYMKLSSYQVTKWSQVIKNLKQLPDPSTTPKNMAKSTSKRGTKTARLSVFQRRA